MTRPVLFAGTRPLGRAENITALYEAYQGSKAYVEVHGDNDHSEIRSGNYKVLIIDDFGCRNPGKCILLWHAIQGGKYIGLNQPHPYTSQNNINKIDYIIAAGDGAIPMWQQCTNFSADKILPLGMPRTDQFIGKTKGDGHTLLANKKAYLYAPTFRLSSEPLFFQLDYDWLDKQLTDDEIFAVKAHMVGKKILSKKYNHIVEISQNEPSIPYLYDCNILITDYSSIIFDGYLLNKPAILFEKSGGYAASRGMYMNYPNEYCSKYATNEQELLNLLRSTIELTEIERNCVQRVANKCDGNSCQRICELIKKLNF